MAYLKACVLNLCYTAFRDIVLSPSSTAHKSFRNLPIFRIYSKGLIRQWSADGHFFWHFSSKRVSSTRFHVSEVALVYGPPEGTQVRGLLRIAMITLPQNPVSPGRWTMHPALGQPVPPESETGLLTSFLILPRMRVRAGMKTESSDSLRQCPAFSFCIKSLCPLC